MKYKQEWNVLIKNRMKVRMVNIQQRF